MILNLRTLKENLTHIGWAPMKLIVFDNGSVRVKTIDDVNFTFLVNGQRLKLYQKPQSKEEVVEEIVKKKEMEMVGEGVIPSTISS